MTNSFHSSPKRVDMTMYTSTNKSVVLLVSCVAIILYIVTVYDFLTVVEPVNGEVLVIEGWIPSTLIKQAPDIFEQGSYEMIVAVGGPMKQGNDDIANNSFAFRCRDELIEYGVPANRITALPLKNVVRNRTLSGAQAFSSWLNEQDWPVNGVDVFTASVHGRKSWLLYRRALRKEVQVGVISAESGQYRHGRWISSSYMSYRVIRNTIGFLYAFLFMF